MQKPDSLENSLVKTISESDLADIGIDALDEALDDLPIPIFSTLRKLYRGARSVQHYFYVKKIIRYLGQIQDIPADERQRQLEKLLSDEERQKFGEHIALVLDRSNDIDKARLMGLVSRAFLEERINLEQLRSLNFLIDAIDPRLIPYINDVCRQYASSYLEDEQALMGYGLLTMKLDVDIEKIGVAGLSGSSNQSIELIKGARVQYAATELAYLFCETCLPEDDDAT